MTVTTTSIHCMAAATHSHQPCVCAADNSKSKPRHTTNDAAAVASAAPL